MTMPLLTLGLCLLAQVGDAERESDMFGAEPAETATGAASTPEVERPPLSADGAPTSDDRDNAMFGEPESTSTPGTVGLASTMVGLLDERDDALTLGGQLFLRLNSSFRETAALGESLVTGPSLLDTFADVRPNDRVRAFAQLRFNFDYTIVPGERNFLGMEQEPFTLQMA
ncbi:MAG: hypothetical protein ACO3JL_20455, partial [Myxococcota bacterium]